jgi:rhamnose utilization protein RhaD (predicted bifunctional aldolase and dehydrogenase)
MNAQASAFRVHAFAKAVIASVTAAAAARIDRIAGSAFMFVSSFVQGFSLCSECGSLPKPFV